MVKFCSWKITTLLAYIFLFITILVAGKKKSPECIEYYKSALLGCRSCNESDSEANINACRKEEKGGFKSKQSPKCYLGFKASAPNNTDCKFCEDDLKCCFDEADHYPSRCGPHRLKESPECPSGKTVNKNGPNSHRCVGEYNNPREVGGFPGKLKKSYNCMLGFHGGKTLWNQEQCKEATGVDAKPCMLPCIPCTNSTCCVEEGNPQFCQST